MIIHSLFVHCNIVDNQRHWDSLTIKHFVLRIFVTLIIFSDTGYFKKHYWQLSLNMASKLANVHCFIKHCWVAHEHNSRTSSVWKNDFPAELTVIASTDCKINCKGTVKTKRNVKWSMWPNSFECYVNTLNSLLILSFIVCDTHQLRNVWFGSTTTLSSPQK